MSKPAETLYALRVEEFPKDPIVAKGPPSLFVGTKTPETKMNETNTKRRKSGDVVMLRSGGPTMTVLDVGETTGIIFCQWMDEGVIRLWAFSPEMIITDPRHRQ